MSKKEPDLHMAYEKVPSICFIDDVARILRMSRRTVITLANSGALPVVELERIGGRRRWSGASLEKVLRGRCALGTSHAKDHERRTSKTVRVRQAQLAEVLAPLAREFSPRGPRVSLLARPRGAAA